MYLIPEAPINTLDFYFIFVQTKVFVPSYFANLKDFIQKAGNILFMSKINNVNVFLT